MSNHSHRPPFFGRSRWAAIGATVAVSLGAGGMFVTHAAPGPEESTIVSVTPERILDTRDPVNLGLVGPFVSAVGQKLQVTGSIPTATGTKVVVPTGATGVLLNVTSVGSTANGFISVRPGDATGVPSTSSLNVNAGDIVPNSVQVGMPTAGANAGKIDITWDASASQDLGPTSSSTSSATRRTSASRSSSRTRSGRRRPCWGTPERTPTTRSPSTSNCFAP